MQKLFAFDVESNGLHGEGFAVGSVVVDAASGEELAAFVGRAPIQGEWDPWVRDNVLPVLAGLEETHPDTASLRGAFWAFLQEHKTGSIVVADIGYPVEARFLVQCQDDAPEARAWSGPYPLHEVASFLLAAGVDPDVNREEYADVSAEEKHNPLHDARVSAACARKALAAIRS